MDLLIIIIIIVVIVFARKRKEENEYRQEIIEDSEQSFDISEEKEKRYRQVCEQIIRKYAQFASMASNMIVERHWDIHKCRADESYGSYYKIVAICSVPVDISFDMKKYHNSNPSDQSYWANAIIQRLFGSQYSLSYMEPEFFIDHLIPGQAYSDILSGKHSDGFDKSIADPAWDWDYFYMVFPISYSINMEDKDEVIRRLNDVGIYVY